MVVVVLVAKWNHHVEPVDSTALEYDDQLLVLAKEWLGSQRSASDEARYHAHPHHSQRTVFEENASGNHAQLLCPV